MDHQNEPSLNLEFDRRRTDCDWTLKGSVNSRKRRSFDWRKKKVWHSCCRTRRMERKSQLKTIQVRLFSVSLISFSWSCFCIGDVSDDEEVVCSGDGMHRWLFRLPMRTCSVWHPASCDAARCIDQISHWRRESTESWAHNSGLLTDMIEWFLSHRSAIMDFGATPYEVLKPFSYGLSSPALAPALFCLIFFQFSFYKCVLYCFSFWFPLDLNLFFFLFFRISVLVWFGLRLLCVWSHEFSVSKLSLSPFPVLSFDLMVFVFLFRVYCY